MKQTLIKLVKGLFLNKRFRSKLLITYISLILLPLFVYTVVSYDRVSQLIEQSVTYSARQSFNQALLLLQYRISAAESVSNALLLDSGMANVFSKASEVYPVNQQIKDYTYLNKYIQNMERNSSIYRIRLFFNDQLLYSEDRVNTFKISSVKETQWFQALLSKSIMQDWSLDSHTRRYMGNDAQNDPDQGIVQVLSVKRLIYNPNDYTQVVGALSVDIKVSEIESMLFAAEGITTLGTLYLEKIESEYQVIVSQATDILSVPAAVLSSVPEGQWKRVHDGANKLLLCHSKLSDTGWRLVAAIPHERLIASSVSQRNSLLLVALIISIAVLIMAYIASMFITRRISYLIQQVRTTKGGTFPRIRIEKGNDEINELASAFAGLLDKIEALVSEQHQAIEKVKDTEVRIVRAELETLQAQINPHFLYNTLDMINWTAIKNNCPDIEEQVKLLSRYYKQSLNMGKEIVTIADEARHVTTYVELQNMRFGNRIVLKIDIGTVAMFVLPKITLQPLVENAIIHGIQKKSSGSGTITIKGALEGDLISITITDDGVGMDSAFIDKLLSNRELAQGSYGIMNINERLKLHFGPSSSLSFSSAPDKGTAVVIKVKAMTQ